MTGREAKLRAEVLRLRCGIQAFLDGNYPPMLKTAPEKCPHGQYRHETCEACIEVHFAKLLASGEETK
jgi:hypothetical protein